MRRKSINTEVLNKTTVKEAKEAFITSCKVKNLSGRTIDYYTRCIDLFEERTKIQFVDEIDISTIERYISIGLSIGNKATSINTILRGVKAFCRYCYDGKLISEEVKVTFIKADEEVKEPYTDNELKLLLRKPKTDNWVEWRNWAAINYFVATGNRASTVTALKIEDINFNENTIFLSKLKNRKQQIIPLSSALKEVLLLYLSLWEHTPEMPLFPNNEDGTIAVRSLQCSIKKYNNSRGVKKSSIHLFRHTFAKKYILAGGGVAQLQLLLGHSTLDMTMHYVNLYGVELAADFDRFNPLDIMLNKK